VVEGGFGASDLLGAEGCSDVLLERAGVVEKVFGTSGSFGTADSAEGEEEEEEVACWLATLSCEGAELAVSVESKSEMRAIAKAASAALLI